MNQRFYTTHEEAQRNSKRGAAVGAIRIDGVLYDLVFPRNDAPRICQKGMFVPGIRQATNREIDSIRKWESI